ncbi:MAG: DEAD/DEAH box helicase [Traorella sp.]
MSNFYKLGLSNELIRAVEECGYFEPTKIQEEAIPALLKGHDVLGKSNTGTGKTAAFGLPAIDKVDASNHQPQILILAPTRELDLQIALELRKFSKYKEGIKIVPIYGGESIENQIRQLKRGCNIVVGTPGRVMDHLRRKTLKLDAISMVILDEADEMLNMGFKEDIETILNYIEQDYQMALFSATMPPAILDIIDQFQDNPVIVEIKSAQRTIDTVEQVYYECKRGQKVDALRALLETLQPQLTMIFTNTKKMVEELVDELNQYDIKAIGLHGDMKQQARTRVMDQFKQRNYPILIATDVAARGIDVDDIDLVVNYDIPQDNEYYIHRVGRTGRAGKKGMAITLVSGKSQLRFMKDIAKYTKTHIRNVPLPSCEQLVENNKNKYVDAVLQVCQDEIDSETFEIANRLLSEDISIEYLVSALVSMSYKPLDIKVENIPEKKKKERRFNKNETTTIHINVGKKLGITPANIVAAIVEYTNRSSDIIGKIDMRGSYTLVDIENSAVNSVLNALQVFTIKKYEANAKLDEGSKGFKVINESKPSKESRKSKKKSSRSHTKTEKAKKRRTRSDK